MSAFGGKADMTSGHLDVRFWPKADINDLFRCDAQFSIRDVLTCSRRSGEEAYDLRRQ